MDPQDEINFGSTEAASLGGKARAESLSPERRSEIARAAVEARWAKEGKATVPKATHTGTLKVGDFELECAVLDDGVRVLSQRGFMSALGFKHGGAMERSVGDAGDLLPFFIAHKSLRPFIDNDLMLVLISPVKYQNPRGGGVAHGIRADVIPRVCDVWLRARDGGALKKQALLRTAEKADILMRGLAHVGIIALVDEATGYQDARARDALARILEAFVAKELQPYVKMFPVEYFKGLYRLKGLEWPPKGNKMPRYFGVITNDIIYSRLAPGLLRRLNEKNPKSGAKGYRKSKNTQWLTDDVGRPKLLEHMAVATAFMQVCPDGDYDGFHKLLDRARPKQIEAPLFDHLDDGKSLVSG